MKIRHLQEYAFFFFFFWDMAESKLKKLEWLGHGYIQSKVDGDDDEVPKRVSKRHTQTTAADQFVTFDCRFQHDSLLEKCHCSVEKRG